jgi:NAD(P)H-dependent flavin oxidoreductase YrpB (nitropropane dioxygenase family)
MTLKEFARSLDEVRDRTTAPFGVNFRSDNPEVEQIVDLMIKRGVKLASYGRAPRKDLIQKLKAAGIVNVPTVGALRHAQKVVEWGVDAVIVQGGEGGGHTGEVPTSLLLPQVVDAVDIPVIGAGGYFDGRGLVAALAYGAGGIAMGTRFLLTRESPVPDSIKSIYLSQTVTDTVVTRSIDGAPQRVVKTPMVTRLERSGGLSRIIQGTRSGLRFQKITGTSFRSLLREGFTMKRSQELSWAQMLMAANAPMLTRASLVHGHSETGVLPIGQVVGLITDIPTVQELLDRIMAEAKHAIERLDKLSATRVR